MDAPITNRQWAWEPPSADSPCVPIMQFIAVCVTLLVLRILITAENWEVNQLRQAYRLQRTFSRQARGVASAL
ncbi:hypothetical protein F5Y13DRAFT_184842 [Hypoxylon sp. FL1857]|nr:hypothetical protein F5Y13DRAFT_184842 [Hypoxylon sp. FL1857]